MYTLELTSPLGIALDDAYVAAAVRRELRRDDLRAVVVKRSADLRGKPLWRYRVDVYAPDEEYVPYTLPEYRDVHDAPAVAVVGAGPAGMFAALRLLMEGLKPIILERGKSVHERKKDIAALSRDGVLDPESNFCYGEGGAGTFSDGKLYTRSSKRGDNREVLHQFVRFGADPSILIDAHPHIGSDKLPAIVENIRNCIIEHGGEYHFSSKVVSIDDLPDGKLVRTADGSAYDVRAVILATGHSARDVYEMLLARGGKLEAKGFAFGVRVEHPQSLINAAQYHGAWRPGMPAAEYSFVQQVDGRGVFSFCMCPGGVLVPSSTEDGTVVLNGMSGSGRSSRWANAGVVVQIEPEDVPGDDPLRLLDFQQEAERRAVVPGSEPFAAPAQRMKDFCEGRISSTLPETSYKRGAVSSPLHEILPPVVAGSLRKAFPKVGIRGYYSNEALLLGVESRTSSPVRIARDPETLCGTALKGIYPAGEGAGYAGGIVSSAVDGIRAAMSVAAELKN